MMRANERDAAKRAGAKTYFTGKSCKNGHIAARQVSNGGCVVCRADALRAHRKTDLGKQTSRRCAREWHEEHGSKPEQRGAAIRRARKWNSLNGKKPEVLKRAVMRQKKHLKTERGRGRRNAYQVERRRSDPAVKLQYLLRSRLSSALKGRAKPASAIALLGCSSEEALTHIARQFVEGMTWANWGLGNGCKQYWHVDHIKPVSSFDITNPVDASRAFHYTNLQPLWAIDNIRKGAKVGSCAH